MIAHSITRKLARVIRENGTVATAVREHFVVDELDRLPDALQEALSDTVRTEDRLVELLDAAEGETT